MKTAACALIEPDVIRLRRDKDDVRIVCFPRTFEINRFRCARGSLSGGFVEAISNLPKRFLSPKCSCGLVSPMAAAATEWLWRVDVNV